ncbi:ABC transporter permease [Phycisphaera mikurensis]|uniref:Putative ABC transporter permease protein n=1 Tax=Phycisphaera mikurensis (strain NBRC 102666 / KCTC 22515 / FYK2301M01) TaxID=1142394 RepID=I0IHC9_PHYMF|nr:ABC transporter permease subunit [Phycisphaera mikurensis]MBB6440916.1 peptide/nickel transport system permease protein [Phycisphaera mikurensis]BAM04667.1 putative ABC transporter permease protein [Phycisphaera mikurensis NBRC 102666]
MLAYTLRRLALLVPTLLGVLAVVFFVMAMAPGGFGGAALNAEGAQTQGQDAKRIRLQLERRYGLDQPAYVQFGRWLNRVSPVGFRSSDDLSFGDQEREAAATAFEGLEMVSRPRVKWAAVDLAGELAAYQAVPLADAAAGLRATLDAAGAGELDETLFEALDSPLSAADRERLLPRIAADGAPGAAQSAVQGALQEAAAGRSRVRFDKPAIKWPDLGTSLRGRKVTELLASAVPVTVLLNALSIPIIYLVAIGAGLGAASKRGGAFDLGSGALFLSLWSVPTIWAGVLAINYLASAENLRWFPTGGLHDLRASEMPFFPRFGGGEAGFERGYLLDTAWHLVLPVTILTYGGFAVTAKVMRGAVLDSLSADYVRTARAKGLSPRAVLWKHAFRNSVLPLVTLASSLLPALLGGSVVVETIFSIEGMGKLGVDAAFQKDREVVMAVTLIGGVLGLLSEVLRDLLYAAVDPRVSYD